MDRVTGQDAQTNTSRVAFTVEEARQKLGISRGLLYKLAKAGDLTLIKLGARSLILASELERLLAARTAAARTEVVR